MGARDVGRRAVHGLEDAQAARAEQALGSMPSEPVSMAASSDRMSPNMFSVSSTSNSAGEATARRMAAVSTKEWSSGISACSALPR